LPAIAETPLNPKLRRPVPMRTWYPNSPSADGAAPVSLRPGEHREGVDIEAKKSPSYCIEGTFDSPSGPAGLSFNIEALRPSSGVSSGMGMYMAAPGGATGPDGRFRICDLYPGSYRLSVVQRGASQEEQPPAYGAAEIVISDKDIANIKLPASPGVTLEGEVVWAGAAPENPLTTTVSVSLHPLVRTSFRGEDQSRRPGIPARFSFPASFIDDYQVWTLVNGPGLYIQDVTYGGRSVRYEPLRLGGAMQGSGLRVVVAHDGATLSAQVRDKDGNPVADIRVLIIPAETTSEAMLAARLVSGQTNQLGQYKSTTLAPGKYYVAASDDTVDATPEKIGRLWRSRNRFQEVDLAANGSVQVTLQPVKIE
jgi:hypothetical protein